MFVVFLEYIGFCVTQTLLVEVPSLLLILVMPVSSAVIASMMGMTVFLMILLWWLRFFVLVGHFSGLLETLFKRFY